MGHIIRADDSDISISVNSVKTSPLFSLVIRGTLDIVALEKDGPTKITPMRDFVHADLAGDYGQFKPNFKEHRDLLLKSVRHNLSTRFPKRTWVYVMDMRGIRDPRAR